MPREYTHIGGVLPGGRVDPSKTRVRCEAPGCPNEVLIDPSYSFIVAVCCATTGPHQPIAPIRCEEEQHFACSPACARAAVIACIDNDLMPKLLAAEAARLESVQ